MRKHWISLIALMMVLAFGTTTLAAANHASTTKTEQTKPVDAKVKAEKAKEMKAKMGGLNALQKESVQLRKDLNAAVQALRQALVKAQKDGKNVSEIAKLVPGIKALKAPLEEAIKAQTEDEAEDKKYKEAKKVKDADTAGKAIAVRTAKLQAKIDALNKALVAVKDLTTKLAAIQ